MIQNDTVISVNGLEKSYKNLKVLKKVDFSVKRGSIFALLGSNGAGKTTTIKILSTLAKADKGSVKICGFDVLKQADKVRREISLTGQYAAVDEVLTGRENLQLIGKLHHIHNVDKKANELLEKFKLLDAADRPASTYSGGMRRRLDIAMGLIGNPSVIFLDEPTTGLDPQSRIAMWNIIKELSASGITVLLTTQYLEEAEQLADEIAILNEGKIVAKGTVKELKKLLPYGHIELRFGDENGIKLACDLLSEYNVSLDEKNSTISIVTDGSIKQMADILNKLEKSNLLVLELSQIKPTLEDVFLNIIGEN
ncbi:daunorubicin resistance protein DrrA family ABC transporter ATP-binding protein [Faecalimicrobium dakarense]|uniref:daunorubicin resistance protein DrrA family ABC transporter ATP-binding protein n=1 Tax=Faecalimicrobium dakarense TaxID=1301100 RepID=UPI0004BAC01E|nr:daunorubicin resistance protein DrrA family ABC transporter ATP-binding protein [[Clostridium] dakarense]